MKRSISVLLPVAALSLAAISATACGSSVSGGSPGGPNSPAAARTTTLTVLAAASLTEAFGQLKSTFEAAHPGVTVKFNFAGSSTLAQQIINGAPADVFSSADQSNMAKVVKPQLVDGQPQVFATNELEIAVPPGNPKHLAAFADLAKPGITVLTCAPAVPCGNATKEVERSTGVQLKPASEETDVKAVLHKVGAGEADAGLVYVTDVNSAENKVQGVPFPESAKGINAYPIAVVKDSPQRELARQFVDLVRGAGGRAALNKVGFRTP